ncbi:MAG: signal peptidase II [Chloroflexota bacterium]|nr:signal peptidase II [Chloroflexota bacterium]
MPRPSNQAGWWWSSVFLLIALLVLVTDQLTKLWIRSHLFAGQTLFSIGFFRIDYVRNTGAAFGLFQDHTFYLTILSIVGAVVVLVYALVVNPRYPFLTGLRWVALGLILGGTIGNLIDRLRLGYVTDFIDFTYWPAFNIADASVTTGVILFAYTLLSLVRDEPDGKKT